MPTSMPMPIGAMITPLRPMPSAHPSPVPRKIARSELGHRNAGIRQPGQVDGFSLLDQPSCEAQVARRVGSEGGSATRLRRWSLPAMLNKQ